MNSWTLLAPLFIALVLLGSACEEEEIFDIVCPSFNTDLLTYFPPRPGDTLQFADSSGMTIRRFPVEGRFIFSDTTYESLLESDVCVPFAEYLISEDGADRTVINYFINQLDQPAGGVAIGVNFSDRGATGAPYFQQVQVRPSVQGNLNTEATFIDTLRVDGFLYDDVVLAELIGPIPGANTYFNDVRKIWLAPNGGIIQFEDVRSGLWRLLRP